MALITSLVAVLAVSIATIGRNTSAALVAMAAWALVVERIVAGLRPQLARFMIGENVATVVPWSQMTNVDFERPPIVALAALVAYLIAVVALATVSFTAGTSSPRDHDPREHAGRGDDRLQAPRRVARLAVRSPCRVPALAWPSGDVTADDLTMTGAVAPALDVDRFVADLFRAEGVSLRAPRPAVRRRSQRGRRPRAGGLHPSRPQRPPHRGSRPGAGLPALDRAQPGPRPQPPRPRVAAPPLADHRACRPASTTSSPCATTSAEVLDALRELPGPTARLPRAPLLRRARHRRHRGDPRRVPQLGQDPPAARSGRARSPSHGGPRGGS